MLAAYLSFSATLGDKLTKTAPLGIHNHLASLFLMLSYFSIVYWKIKI